MKSATVECATVESATGGHPARRTRALRLGLRPTNTTAPPSSHYGIRHSAVDLGRLRRGSPCSSARRQGVSTQSGGRGAYWQVTLVRHADGARWQTTLTDELTDELTDDFGRPRGRKRLAFSGGSAVRAVRETGADRPRKSRAGCGRTPCVSAKTRQLSRCH